MKLVFLLTFIFIFTTSLAINPFRFQPHTQEQESTGSTHSFSKRQTEFVGPFPALGGPKKAGKVFTTTASIFTQSNNLIVTPKRSGLTFVENSPEKLVDNKGQRLQARPEVVLVRKNNVVLEGTEDETESSDEKDPSSTSEQPETNTAGAQAKPRLLLRRSLYQKNRLKRSTDETGETDKDVESMSDAPSGLPGSDNGNLQVQSDQKNLGLFPALGGLNGVISAEEAQLTVAKRISNVSPEISEIITIPPNVAIIPLQSQTPGYLIPPPCDQLFLFR